MRVEIDESRRYDAALGIHERLTVHRRRRSRNPRDNTALHDDVAHRIQGARRVHYAAADNAESAVHEWDPGEGATPPQLSPCDWREPAWRIAWMPLTVGSKISGDPAPSPCAGR